MEMPLLDNNATRCTDSNKGTSHLRVILQCGGVTEALLEESKEIRLHQRKALCACVKITPFRQWVVMSLTMTPSLCG